MNKIVEKYFNQEDFSQREQEALSHVSSITGFVPQQLLFRGMIYDQDKVGSIIYKGIYQGKDAVLKLQGLEPETDEADILLTFKKQNTSQKIRLPDLYDFRRWNQKDGYGYLVTEYITAPRIYTMPYVTDKQINLFCQFYQEYRDNCLNKPFVPKPQENAIEFVLRRVDMWQKIAYHKKNLLDRISKEEIEKLIVRYKLYMGKNLLSDMVFCHGHLSGADIFYDDNEFILLSNLYWSYRPLYYDLIFGLHWCLEAFKDKNITYDEYTMYINNWLMFLYKIPSVKHDPRAKQQIHCMLLERTMGAVLIDTGSQMQIGKLTNNLFSIQTSYLYSLMKL